MSRSETVLEAMRSFGGPCSRIDLASEPLCDGLMRDQISRALYDLKARGLIELCGTQKIARPSRGQSPEVTLYRLVEPTEPADQDPDVQLAAAIRERDRDDDEALVSTDEPQSPLATKVPRPASHNRCAICNTPLDDYDGGDTCTHCAEELASAEIHNRDETQVLSDDPVIRELARYRPRPRIQDGARLAGHLRAGAHTLQDELPALSTSLREAAAALEEFAA